MMNRIKATNKGRMTVMAMSEPKGLHNTPASTINGAKESQGDGDVVCVR